MSDTQVLPLSGTVREQTARHQDATEKSESSYGDAPFRRILNTVGAIMCLKGSYFKRYENVDSSDYQGGASVSVNSRNIY